MPSRSFFFFSFFSVLLAKETCCPDKSRGTPVRHHTLSRYIIDFYNFAGTSMRKVIKLHCEHVLPLKAAISRGKLEYG